MYSKAAWLSGSRLSINYPTPARRALQEQIIKRRLLSSQRWFIVPTANCSRYRFRAAAQERRVKYCRAANVDDLEKEKHQKPFVTFETLAGVVYSRSLKSLLALEDLLTRQSRGLVRHECTNFDNQSAKLTMKTDYKNRSLCILPLIS